MNWYKSALKTYTDIAHINGDYEYMIWIFKEGKMHMSEVYNAQDVHASHSTEFPNSHDANTTSGRYNVTTGELSISPALRFRRSLNCLRNS